MNFGDVGVGAPVRAGPPGPALTAFEQAGQGTGGESGIGARKLVTYGDGGVGKWGAWI